VFIGYATDEPDKGGIDCIGTAFLLRHEGFPYLITARHVAEFVGADPFLLRVNRFDGAADNLQIDQAGWYYDSDPTVDVAVLPIADLLNDNEHCVQFIDDEKESWWSNKAWKYGVGIVDFCYTVGLFRVLSGRKQNLPTFTLAQSPALSTGLTRSRFRLRIGATRTDEQLFSPTHIWSRAKVFQDSAVLRYSSELQIISFAMN